VRFAVECLPIATPPEPMPPVHEARLRRGWGHRFFPREGGHRDPGAFHDLEDVRDVYTEGLFDVRVTDLRRRDPERAVELFRATSAEIFSRVLSEWRRPGSPCAGVMPFHFVDLRHGQDLGMVDLIGRPKASWYVMRRLMKPVALLLTDEGLSGLGVHIVNDSARPLSAQVRVDLYLDGVTLLESASIPVQLSERDAETIDVSTIFGSFRDLSYAYRFGRPAADVVAVTLSDDAGWELDTSIYLPGGCARPQQRDVGISAALEQCDEGWAATLTTKEFAHWVSFDVPNWRPSDSWFHLLPDRPVRVILTPEADATRLPRGYVGALNSLTRCPLTANEV
jgi:beta-mannosidase